MCMTALGLCAGRAEKRGRRGDAHDDRRPRRRCDKPFANVFDMARRVDLKRVGKRPLEMLARAGAFDQLDPNRRRSFDSLDALTIIPPRFMTSGHAIRSASLARRVMICPNRACRLSAIGCLPNVWPRSSRRLDSTSLAIRLMTICPPSNAKGALTLDDVMLKAERGACL